MKEKIKTFIGKHKKLLIILAVLIVAFVVLPMIFGKKAVAVDDTYQTQTPTKQDLQVELTGTGTIEPNDQYSITPMVQGEIVEADFEEGDIVEEGQVLYLFSTESIEDSIKSAEIGVKQAQQSYQDAVDGVQNTQDNLSLTADVEGYVKKLYVDEGDAIAAGTKIADLYDNTTMVLSIPFNEAEVADAWIGARAEVLLSDESETLRGTVTAIDPMSDTLSGNRIVRYVTIEVKNPGTISADSTATASIRGTDCSAEGNFSVKSEGTLLAAGTGTIESLKIAEGDYVDKGDTYLVLEDSTVGDSVNSAKLSLESANNQLDTAKRSLEDYSVTAPISGTVITKNAKAGDNINAAFTSPLAVIYDLSKVKFCMKVDELDVLKLSVGQEVLVSADALEGVEMIGHITNISLEASTNGGVSEYPVTVELDEVGDLLPGMNVSARIVLEEEKNALCIPVDALMRGDIVYVKNKEGQETSEEELSDGVPVGFHQVEVTVGISNDSSVQILSGLSETDEVYVPRTELTDMNALLMGAGGEDMEMNMEDGTGSMDGE